MSFKRGDHIGDYEISNFCGGGAYGEVYAAFNTAVGERVALKILRPTPKTLERELRGVLRFRECRNAHLIRIRHIETAGDFFYYTMDLADCLDAESGGYLPDTLANRLERQHRLPPETVELLADAMTEALDALHRHGLVHRDVKPDNILWINGIPVLGDAGLTADADNNSLVGTPDFMPVELLRHERDARPEDDFYALTRVLYCAFTGEAPANYPRCPEGLLDAGNAALWRRILEPGPTKRAPKRRLRLWPLAAAGAILIALAGTGAWLSHRRPPAAAKVPMPLDEKRVAADRKRGIKFSADGRILLEYNRDLKDREYIIPDGVTAIENEAFSHSRFESVKIPESVTEIGEGAFLDCSLTGVAIPSGVTVISDGAFAACSDLQSVTLPDGVTRIGDYAFRKCKKLAKVKIPSSVKSIGEHAFEGCPCEAQLKRDHARLFAADKPKVGFNRDGSVLVKYDRLNRHREYAVPAGVTEIGDNAFRDCRNLVKVTMPDGVTKIGFFAFSGCDSLVGIAIPGSVETICTNAFENCTSLTEVTFNPGLKTIGADSFNGCVNLARAIIPEGVTTIGRGAFKGCKNLKRVDIPPGVKAIGKDAFDGCPFEAQIKRRYAHLLF